ncbi:MAG: hemolysin family protein [Eubacteriales bacterium]
MDDIEPTASIIILFAFLIFEMLLYGFSMALQNVGARELEQLRERDKAKDKRVLHILENPFRYVNTTQYLRVLSTLMVGCYVIDAITHNGQLWIESWKGTISWLNIQGIRLIVLLCIAGIFFVIGIFIPKCIAKKHPVDVLRLLINGIVVLSVVAYPIVVVLQWIGRQILKIFHITDREILQDVTEDEVISMIQEGHEQGVFQSSEAQMITNIFEYTDKDVKDIMIWQKNIVSLDGSKKLKELEFTEQYSRYPVYLEDLNHIIGILHIKDALKMQLAGDDLDLAIEEIPNLLLKVEFVPETKKIDLLFKEMQSSKSQMVMVVDEYGQTSGLVAMEDILEEIVGNIFDEYDQDEAYIEMKSDNEYLIDGITPIDTVEEQLGIHFPESEFDTINGYLIAQIEHLPEDNESFECELEGYSFKVASVKNKMIETVVVNKIESEG